MDFDEQDDEPGNHDAGYSVASQESSSSRSAVSSSRSSSNTTSIRVRKSGKTTSLRRRPRSRPAASAPAQPHDDTTTTDSQSILTSSSSPSMLVVKGAGTSSWAIQDAGTVQMLKDEASYLCSTLRSARSPCQALETAVELAQLLSSAKSRSILWSTCSSSGGGMEGTDSPPPTSRPLGSASSTSAAPKGGRTRTRKTTILDAILDVTAGSLVGKVSSSSSSSSTGSTNRSVTTSAPPPASPSKARTKSARRRWKAQLQSAGGAAEEGGGSANFNWWGGTAMTTTTTTSTQLPELGQTLAVILYFISLDCTLSKEYSVAHMGVAPKPALARTVRSIVMHHPKALQGMVHFCLDPLETVTKSSSVASSSTTSTTTRQRHPHRGIPSSVTSGASHPLPGSAQSELTVDVTVQPGGIRRRILPRTTTTPDHLSPQDSLSSLSFGGGTTADNNSTKFAVPVFSSTSATPKSSGSGDPTKAGRLKRRRRQVGSMDQKLAAVPEHSQQGDELDWQLDKIVPPPSKKNRTLNSSGSSRRRNDVQGDLDFSSNDGVSLGTKESSLVFSEPLSPAGQRTHPIVASLPASPGDRSVASSVVSVESASSIVNARTAQRLHQLKAKVHLTSSPSNSKLAPANLQEDCNTAWMSGCADPWVSLVCLESLNRIVAGKEGDGTSCLAQEPNEDEEGDTIMDEEESNPLLQTNRLLGKSGIIPLLSKCMSQGLTEGLVGDDSSATTAHNTHTCPRCRQNWGDRMAVLASLIDNACLFNKANRRSFVEHYDPFSFDEDPLQNSSNSTRGQEGLLFHILQFLHSTLSWDYEGDTGSCPDESIGQTQVRLLALRTLTSLTHDNDLAAELMTTQHSFDGRTTTADRSIDFGNPEPKLTRGVDVLTRLAFELEGGGPYTTSKNQGKSEEESHRFDSTIFCLNTLSNIIEGPLVRQLLAETHIVTKNGKRMLWIRWLCHWLVEQTSDFREAILSIGKKSNNGTSSSQGSDRELHQSEDDKLIAAGNGCVLLACLMKEPEEVVEEDEDFTERIRTVVLEEMPHDKGGKSVGVALIINTLKAFCNFYHFSLGELSLAIVGPVKKLIDHLAELKK